LVMHFLQVIDTDSYFLTRSTVRFLACGNCCSHLAIIGGSIGGSFNDITRSYLDLLVIRRNREIAGNNESVPGRIESSRNFLRRSGGSILMATGKRLLCLCLLRR